MKLRIVQHNIRTVAGYYKQIYTKRLAELLGLDEAQAERNVAGKILIEVWHIRQGSSFFLLRTSFFVLFSRKK